MVDFLEKNDEDKDIELDLMAEQELLRLTRQYRVLEGDKEAYVEEASKALRRQRKISDDLKKEKRELLSLLSTTRSRSSSRKESENAAKLSRLAEEQEGLLSDIRDEKNVIGDLAIEVRRIERQIANQRQKAAVKPQSVGKRSGTAGGAKAQLVRDKKDISRRITLLENRLDGVLTSFNATLAKNSSVRKEIDHLVQERAIFNEMIAKCQKKITTNKKTIADITELAIQAFDQRDECQSKVQALQERNEKDAQQYVSELKELQRTLDHDEKLKDFLFHKSNDRVLAAQFEEDERERGKKAAEEKELEDALKHKEAFDKILKIVSSDASLDKIVGDFVKVEDQNFALFNYVTEMNNQVEALQEGIGRLKSDIKEAKGRGEERERQQREQLIGMEKKLEESTKEAEDAETKLHLMENVIDKLKVGVEDLYLEADVGSTPVLQLLEGEQKQHERPFVKESNVIMYLDMIHEKIMELLTVVQYITFKSSSSQPTPRSAMTTKVNPLERQLKRLPSSAQLLGKDDRDFLQPDHDEPVDGEERPYDISTLKTKAFVRAKRDRREALLMAFGNEKRDFETSIIVSSSAASKKCIQDIK